MSLLHSVAFRQIVFNCCLTSWNIAVGGAFNYNF